MDNKVLTLPVSKKAPRRVAPAEPPRAEVLRIADYCRPQAAVETPEQRGSRLEKLLDNIAYHLVSMARLIYSAQS